MTAQAAIYEYLSSVVRDGRVPHGIMLLGTPSEIDWAVGLLGIGLGPLDNITIEGCSAVGAAEVLTLPDNSVYPPAGSARKMYVVRDVEALPEESLRVLLHVLEAPPPHVTLVLASGTEPDVRAQSRAIVLRFDSARTSHGSAAPDRSG